MITMCEVVVIIVMLNNNYSTRSKLEAAWLGHPVRSGLSQDERSISSGSQTPSP